MKVVIIEEKVSEIMLKSIHWVNSSAQGSLFQKMTLMSALASLERFGEKDPFFKKWRSCRHCLQSEWVLDRQALIYPSNFVYITYPNSE